MSNKFGVNFQKTLVRVYHCLESFMACNAVCIDSGMSMSSWFSPRTLCLIDIRKTVLYFSLVKGQLISKCHFGFFKFSKKPTNFFPGFLPQPLKRSQIKKINALFYTNQGLFNIIGIIKFLIQPLFRGQGRNPGKKFVGFFVQTMTPKRHFEINSPLHTKV